MPKLKQLKRHKILLDTHVWIWTVTGDARLKSEFQNALAIIQKTQAVLISPISIWEIGMLVEKERIEIEMDTLDWIQQIIDTPGVVVAPITPRIAIQSTRLPGNIHADPADRILIATAHEEGAVLVTCNKKILAYGKDKFIFVYNPA